MADFSYKRPVMEKLVPQSKSFMWLDHHVSAIEDMKDFPWRPQDVATTDVNRCGTSIVADTFMLREEYQSLVEHIEDRDLWLLKKDKILEFSMGLRSYPKDFKVWEEIFAHDGKNKDSTLIGVEKLKVAGYHIGRDYNQRLEELAKNKKMVEIRGYAVPSVNASYHFASDLANNLSVNYPFAASWYFDGKKYAFSLRSKENGIDVSKIAVSFGGGGHKHAAGFAVESLSEVFASAPLKEYENSNA
jgi:oligoribonuclease NrnB/cAMP/cGMP phosphodiesterase (DHH superfamily)